MIYLYLGTLILFLLSFLVNRKLTLQAFKKGSLLFFNLLPSLLSILLLVSLSLVFLSPQTLETWLGSDSGFLAYAAAALAGSLAMIPGFVAYPLASVLVKNGVSYPVVGVFVTTLMMVGILTIPLERKFFGLKVTLVRNGLSFLGALVIGAFIYFLWPLISA